MSTAQQGGGVFSKLVIVLLLAVTIGLYLQIVLVGSEGMAPEPIPQASLQVLEGASASVSAVPVSSREMPEDQMRVIRQVFAPELH